MALLLKETLDASTSKDNLSSIPISHSLLLPSTPPVSTSQPDEDLAATICSEKRIEKAFSLLNPNKAPGPDNISNKLLSHAWPLLKPTFTQIFRDSIRLGVIPQAWQSSKAIFLYKSGKKNPHDANNWRTINLCSSTLKVLEKVILMYLNDSVGLDNSLSDHQLGFRKGRSTDEALHRLVSHIEKSLIKGEFALSCF